MMALEAAFRKQLSKQKCVVCGEMIPFGVYSRHLNSCITDPNDEECKVIQFLTAEDKKQIAIKNAITLDDSSSSVDDNSSTTPTKGDFSPILFPLTDINKICSGETASNANAQTPSVTATANITAVTLSEVLSKSSSSSEKPRAAASQSPTCKEDMTRNNSTEASALFSRKRMAKALLKENTEEGEKKRIIVNNERVACNVQMSLTAAVKQEEKFLFRSSFKKECSPPFSTLEPKTQALALAERKRLGDVQTLEEVVEGFCNYFKTCTCVIAGRKEIESEMTFDVESREGRSASPYYLILFNYILKKVFEVNQNTTDKQQLISFWGNELRYLQRFMFLSIPSKQLFIRLLLRRRNWLSVERLKYDNIATDLTPLFEEMVAGELVEESKTYPFELENAVRLLEAPSIKNVAKKFKLDYTLSKEEIIQKLLNLSKQKNIFGLPLSGQILKIVRTEMGARYRIKQEVLKFMMSVFTLFSPIDMDSSVLLDQPTVNLASQLLFFMLQLRLKKIRFPAPAAPRMLNIFTNRSLLYGYVEAKLIESEMAYLMQKNIWNEVQQLATKSIDSFAECYSTNKDFIDSLPPYLRRFTDCWVYVRCISHGVEAYQRLRQYADAVKLLRCLLYAQEYKMFLTSARGSWWDRLALNLDSHLKNKTESFEAVKLGIIDDALGEKDVLLLQMRGEKLNKMWKGPLSIPLPRRTDIAGVTLGKALGDQRANRFTIERNGECYECPVEEVALDYYIKNEGFKEGVHAEGGVWHFIYGLLCYDIIFDHNVKNVWFSETQTNPADLNSKYLYSERKHRFDARFIEIENTNTEELVNQITSIYEEHYGETNSELAWECFTGLDQVKRFLLCCDPKMLTAIFRRITMDYRNCRSGFPDLTVWNSGTKKLAVVEVKGPGDKLSSKQILWLYYFSQQEVRAEVCHVAASHPKLIA